MKSLDNLTNAVTAFTTWAELEVSLKAGYVPTLWQDRRRARLLGKAIVAAGYRFWDPATGRTHS